MRTRISVIAGVCALALGLTACGGGNTDGNATTTPGSGGTTASGDATAGGGDGGEATIKVMYQRTEGVQTIGALFEKAKEQYEADNENVTIELQAIEANENDYATQVALSLQSPDTAPDIFYEDTFRVRADVAAGYLLPLDDYLAEWEDWDQFIDAAKEAGRDGDSIYAIPLGTDTRGIWYNTTVFEAAGVEVPWEPKTWQDILDTAEKIKQHDDSLVPFHMYAGTALGEGGVMQAFLPLLMGTGDKLYDDAEQKWVVGSQGFIDSLAFLKTLYDDGYSVSVEQALDGNLWQRIFDEMFPDNKIGGVVEGSYSSSFWKEGGAFPWAEFEDNVGVAAFPTQEGQGPGAASMSGGWTVVIGAQSEHPDEAFDFLTYVFNYENNLEYVVNASQIAVRSDVGDAPEYKESDPYIEFFTDLVEVTHYRPATEDYPRISAAIQTATEAVVTGSASPEEAAAAYDEAVRGIVGEDNVVEAG